jgi:hypothetical protein
MRIGTDMSIAECRCSGYMVMDFKKRELLKKGVLNKDCPVTLSISNPEGWNDTGRPMIGSGYPLWSLTPTEYSWNDLMDLLDEKSREGIESCCDWKNCQPNLDTPNEYDLLHLASDISSYMSLS